LIIFFVIIYFKDPNYLNYVSHIIIDEVHERSLEIDFILNLLKSYENSKKFSHLKVGKKKNPTEKTFIRLF
jgi:hypothetical protein